jgi:predicted nucleic acid-binding protein
MTPVVIDSSALVALTYPEDADHTRAVALGGAMRETRAIGLISPIVFSETLNILGKKFGRGTALTAGTRIFTDPGLRVMAVDDSVLSSALTHWAEQGGGVSYTDSYVMACADHYRTKDIFGFDAVFAKNGYRLPTAPEKEREAA